MLVVMNDVGSALRGLREEMGLSTREVEAASNALAQKYRNTRFAIPASRLCEFEKRCSTPSIYRLYSLAAIYGKTLEELLRLYGIGGDNSAAELERNSLGPPKSDTLSIGVDSQDFALTREIVFNSHKTRYLGQLDGRGWESSSLLYLRQSANSHCAYGYIGTEDWTMYPLLPPGSLVQIDESRNRISAGGWASEYERPIYFVEMRGKHVCSWCTVSREHIILTPHPLSPVPPKVLEHQDADILGQVVAATVLLGSHHSAFRH